MRLFLRKTRLEREPLAVTMSGVRLGEKALQIGDGDARVIAQIAARTGLTGTAVIVLLDDDAARRIRRAIDDAGAVAEVGVVDQGLRPSDAVFDVVVVHDVRQTVAAADASVRSEWLQLCRRALRPGGRIVAIEAGTPVGFRALFRGRASAGTPDVVNALSSAGFSSVRVLADREGYRFIEGFRTG